MQAILGRKVGMTQVLNAKGDFIPCTVLEAGPCLVTDLKSQEKHGYKAVQVGYGDDVKEKNLSKAYKTNFSKNNLKPKRWLREIRLTPDENFTLGQEIKADIFKAGDLLDIQGKSIGKGFAGGMKKWHWRGGPGTHGSTSHRRIGSIGASSFPSRTWPGHHMPGRLGGYPITVQNLEVLKVDVENNVLVVKGSVPGGDNAILYIRRSLKQPEGVKVRVAPKNIATKDPLKASKQAAAGKGGAAKKK